MSTGATRSPPDRDDRDESHGGKSRREPDALPPPLLTSEVGSFARRTISERAPQILERLIGENAYPPDIVAALEGLRHEVLCQPIRPLREASPDTASWNDMVAAWTGRTWLDTSWYLAEAFFYRRLLEAVRYFDGGPWRGVDPFAPQKRALEARAIDSFRAVPREVARADEALVFETLLHSSLWGNRADLSNSSMQYGPQSGLATRRERHNIIVDDTSRSLATLSAGLSDVSFIADNAGMDVLADLALADFLLERGWVGSITVHLKDRPFFVSDAMPSDVEMLIGRLHASHRPEPRSLALRLKSHRKAGRLELSSDPFWTSCLMYRQMPAHLAGRLSRSDLVVLKGDVNYRRLLDDRRWPFTTSISLCAGYFPAQFVALRTLKGEIMVGLAPGRAERLQREDPDWLVNGQRGVVQMGGPSPGRHGPRSAGCSPIPGSGCAGRTRRKASGLESEGQDA